MRNRLNGVLVVVTLMMFALTWSGCSKKTQSPDKEANKVQPQAKPFAVYTGKAQSQTFDINQPPPADVDIIKAVDDSGVMKRDDGSLIGVPPIKVVEKGKRNKNGIWPVKVKFTLKYKMKDGKISEPTETTTLFSIYETKDNTGKPVIKAHLGS